VCGNLFRGLLGRTGLFVSQNIGGHGPFKMDIRYAFSNFSSWGADRHNDGFTACIEACRGKSCVFDIGAHIGLVSLPMASAVSDGGIVVSFEPGAANRRLLKRHAERNGLDEIIRVEDKLVGAEPLHDVMFYEMDAASGMNSVAVTSKSGTYRQVKKEQISVDAYCEENDLKPELIKIDVEGAEIGVLNGAKKTITAFKPTIFLSYHPRHVKQMGHSADDLISILAELDYTYRHVDGSMVESFSLREYVLTPEGQDVHSP